MPDELTELEVSQGWHWRNKAASGRAALLLLIGALLVFATACTVSMNNTQTEPFPKDGMTPSFTDESVSPVLRTVSPVNDLQEDKPE